MPDRVVVAGAGGLGGVIGAQLAWAGCDVQLLAREPHARAVAEQGGLWVDDRLAPLRADWRPEAIEPADVLILLCKAPDSEEVLAGLDHLRDGLKLALSLQNGVEKEALLAAWCGPEPVVGATTMAGGELVEPGRVRHTHDGTTILGELSHDEGARVRRGAERAAGDDKRPDAPLPAGATPSPRTAPAGSARLHRFAGLLRAGGAPASVTDDVRSAIWSKLATAVGPQALAVLTGLYYHELLLSPPLAAAIAGMTREVSDLAAAHGVELRDWPSLAPVRTIAAAPTDDAIALVADQGRAIERAGATTVTPSMARDARRGHPTEVEALHGFVVRDARAHGVATPLTDLAYALLRYAVRSPTEVTANAG